MFRLPQRHSQNLDGPVLPPADARKLLAAQSVRNAVMAAVIVLIVLNTAWAWLTGLSGRFFPWFSMLQGWAIGLGVRGAGRGLDWRFPLIAAGFATLAAFSGNFIVSLGTTESVLGAGPLTILRGLTLWTWQTWFAEVLTPVDFIYALFAAALAARYAKRRLDRREVHALRTLLSTQERRL